MDAYPVWRPRGSLGRVGVSARDFDRHDVARCRDAAAEAEALGYGAVWVPEGAGREVFAHCAVVLGASRQLAVGSAIASIWPRSAWATRAAANTLSSAHPGRFVLGLGVGHPAFIDAMGLEYTSPVASIRSFLDAMETAPFEANLSGERVPRLLAALGPAMTSIATSRCDGIMPNLLAAEQVKDLRDRVGVTPIVLSQRVVLARDPATARDTARRALSVYLTLPNYARHLQRVGWDSDDLACGGSDRLIDALVAWGDVDAVAHRLRDVLDAGADHLNLHVHGMESGAIPLAEWRELAPAIRDL